MLLAAVFTRRPPAEARVDYSNVVGYDKAANPSEWKSVSQATYVAPGAESTKEFSTSFKTLSHPKPEELEEYKKRWCAAVGAAGCFGVWRGCCQWRVAVCWSHWWRPYRSSGVMLMW